MFFVFFFSLYKRDRRQGGGGEVTAIFQLPLGIRGRMGRSLPLLPLPSFPSPHLWPTPVVEFVCVPCEEGEGVLEARGRPSSQPHPASSLPTVHPSRPAQRSPSPHLCPASYLMLVNLQPLKARLLEVTWAGLQREKSTGALSSQVRGLTLLIQGAEQTHNVTESPQGSLLNVGA